ncbi:MAG: hypothetical protein NZL92_03325 [Gloeomargarita sp. SKYG116]|nr:hypothetical protein [Gloeomargarita sp. SKYG116]MCS7226594.1 hypothetical protein [Gloeomargarita sp. SKYB31]MDW8400713.1 hypothetical protein [Gloeomargarita sp. SKYGB_i_bin116]
MLYAAELFYLENQDNFPFEKAVAVTAKTVGQWCTYFQAGLIIPDDAEVHYGELPVEPGQKQAFIDELLAWIFSHTVSPELFHLILDDEPITETSKVPKFCHADDTGCWVLNLTASEFTELQRVWVDNGLPPDLFYPESETIVVPYDGKGLLAPLLRRLGVTTSYTPRQWQARSQTTLANRSQSEPQI